VAVYVQRDAFAVAVGNGFHLDELRVHVVGAGFGHGWHGVGSQTGPRRDAHVHAFVAFATQVFTPGIVDDVHVGGRARRIDAHGPVSPQNDGANVAGRNLVLRHQVNRRLHQFFDGI